MNKKDLTEEEIKYVEDLQSRGYTPSFITHAIVMGRGVGIHNDIRAQVEVIVKGVKNMIVLSEEEAKKALRLHSNGWDACQITQSILQKRGDAMYNDMRQAVGEMVDNVKEDGL